MFTYGINKNEAMAIIYETFLKEMGLNSGR